MGKPVIFVMKVFLEQYPLPPQNKQINKQKTTYAMGKEGNIWISITQVLKKVHKAHRCSYKM